MGEAQRSGAGKQRRANREVDDVEAHIQHFQAKLRAVDQEVGEQEWAKVCKFTNTDWAAGSQAGDCQEEQDSLDMEAMSVTGGSTTFLDNTQSTAGVHGSVVHANPFRVLGEFSPEAAINGAPAPVQAAIPPQISPPFPLNAPTPFQSPNGSAFLTGGEGSEPLGAALAHAQMLRAEGEKHNIPQTILDAFAGGCPTLENFFASYHYAASAFEHCRATGKGPDLTHAPLAQKMAELLWQMHQQANANAQVVAPAEDSPPQENATGAPTA